MDTSIQKANGLSPRPTGLTTSKVTGISDGSCSRYYSRDVANWALDVHLIELIEHTTKQSERFLQMGTIQQVKGRCIPATGV